MNAKGRVVLNIINGIMLAVMAYGIIVKNKYLFMAAFGWLLMQVVRQTVDLYLESRKANAEARKRKAALKKYGWDFKCEGCGALMHADEHGDCVLDAADCWFYEAKCGHLCILSMWHMVPDYLPESSPLWKARALEAYGKWIEAGRPTRHPLLVQGGRRITVVK